MNLIDGKRYDPTIPDRLGIVPLLLTLACVAVVSLFRKARP